MTTLSIMKGMMLQCLAACSGTAQRFAAFLKPVEDLERPISVSELLKALEGLLNAFSRPFEGLEKTPVRLFKR